MTPSLLEEALLHLRFTPDKELEIAQEGPFQEVVARAQKILKISTEKFLHLVGSYAATQRTLRLLEQERKRLENLIEHTQNLAICEGAANAYYQILRQIEREEKQLKSFADMGPIRVDIIADRNHRIDGGNQNRK